jgi:hypothetical protein
MYRETDTGSDSRADVSRALLTLFPTLVSDIRSLSRALHATWCMMRRARCMLHRTYCTGSFEIDYDYFGSDLDSGRTNINTIEECALLCGQTPACRSFSWGKNPSIWYCSTILANVAPCITLKAGTIPCRSTAMPPQSTTEFLSQVISHVLHEVERDGRAHSQQLLRLRPAMHACADASSNFAACHKRIVGLLHGRLDVFVQQRGLVRLQRWLCNDETAVQ